MHIRRSVKGHLLREAFQRFFVGLEPSAAGKFLDSWSTGAMRSRLDPMTRALGACDASAT